MTYLEPRERKIFWTMVAVVAIALVVGIASLHLAARGRTYTDAQSAQFEVLVYAEFGSMPGDLSKELGRTVCENFDTFGIDDGMVTVAQAAMDSSMSPRDTGILVGASVEAFCPEYREDLTRWMEGL